MMCIQGQCACGANQIEFSHPPIARFICHCLVCQKYTGRAFSDVSVFIRSDIKHMDIQASTFKRYKLPPNIQRGRCRHCHQPSIEFGLLGQMVIIASRNLSPSQALPPPSLHIFYHRRVQDITDHLPKYSGFALSQLYAGKVLLKGLMERSK